MILNLTALFSFFTGNSASSCTLSAWLPSSVRCGLSPVRSLEVAKSPAGIDADSRQKNVTRQEERPDCLEDLEPQTEIRWQNQSSIWLFLHQRFCSLLLSSRHTVPFLWALWSVLVAIRVTHTSTHPRNSDPITTVTSLHYGLFPQPLTDYKAHAGKNLDERKNERLCMQLQLEPLKLLPGTYNNHYL